MATTGWGYNSTNKAVMYDDSSYIKLFPEVIKQDENFKSGNK